MKQANITVMRKILYAVESGGQVYGKQDYSAFAGVGANTPNEKAITIGAGQWYADEAKRLLKLIQEKYPSDFKKLDTAGIYSDLGKSWASYGVTKTSAKGKCIIAIISSAGGIKCQDSLMDTQIKEYAASIEKSHGSMSDTAMMECINIIHQGGASALKRILAKTQKPYTAKSIYAALNTDPSDKTNNNQVGDYVKRQKKVYEFITKYAVAENETKKEDTKMAKTRSAVVALAQSWVGKNEADGSYKSIIDIYNSYTGSFPRGTKMQYGWAWCAATWSALAIKLGYTDIMPIEISCYYLIEAAKKKGIWVENDAYVPKPGDAVLYDWQDSGSGDNTGTPDHVGTVEKVSGNTITVIEGNYSNAVKRRTIQVNGKNIRGYICPKYDGDGTSSSSGTSTAKKSVSVIADEVIAGKWGNGDARKSALEAAGYNYSEVQAAVNAKVSGKTSTSSKKSVSEIAKEVLAGKWGNGEERKKKLQAAGYDYNAVQAEVNKQAKGSGSSTSSSGSSTGGSSRPTYKVGSTYTLKVDAVRVRNGAGTNYAAKSYSQLTANAKQNAYSNGCLKKGTKVTCQQVKNVGNDIWMKIPSGWIAAYYSGSKYVG